MRISTFTLVPVLAVAAFASLATGAAAATSRVDFGFAPLEMNNGGDVVGTRYAAPNFAGVVLRGGVEQALAFPNQSASVRSINSSGQLVGSYDPGEDYVGDDAVMLWSAGSTSGSDVGAIQRGVQVVGDGLDDSGRWLKVQSSAPTCGTSGEIASVRSDGASLALSNVQSGSTSSAIAPDGSFFFTGSVCGSGTYLLAGTTRWISGDGTASATMSETSVTDIASDGVMVGVTALPDTTATRTPVLLRYDSKTRSVTSTPIPIPGLAQGATITPFVGSANKVFANVQQGDGVSMWSLAKGTWTDVTAEFKAPDMTQSGFFVSKIVDVNALGDVLVWHDRSGAVNDTGSIFKSRAALTGQLGVGVPASGRAVATVTVVGPMGTISAKTAANGKFSVDVPLGVTVQVIAPAGSCLVAKNGCWQQASVAVSEDAKSVAIAKTAVKSIATLVTAKNALLRAPSGRVAVKVKCSAAVACWSTATVRTGRTVRGVSARTKIAPGKTGTVTVRLNAAAKAWLAAKRSPVAVATSVVVKAGKETATVTQSHRLSR